MEIAIFKLLLNAKHFKVSPMDAHGVVSRMMAYLWSSKYHDGRQFYFIHGVAP